MQTTTGCNPMWPDHFLSAQTMAYVPVRYLASGLPPADLLGGCAGHVEAAKDQAHGACRWPLAEAG